MTRARTKLAEPLGAQPGLMPEIYADSGEDRSRRAAPKRVRTLRQLAEVYPPTGRPATAAERQQLDAEIRAHAQQVERTNDRGEQLRAQRSGAMRATRDFVAFWSKEGWPALAEAMEAVAREIREGRFVVPPGVAQPTPARRKGGRR